MDQNLCSSKLKECTNCYGQLSSGEPLPRMRLGPQARWTLNRRVIDIKLTV